jgi:peroxiredoxin
MTTQTLAESLQEAFERCKASEGSLNERLALFAAAVRSLSPDFAAGVDRLVARLQQSHAGAAAPEPGDPMPPFVLPDSGDRLVSLDELLSNGPVAVVFNRGHWCPYCRLNTDALTRAQQQVADRGAQIVSIMPDRQQFTTELRVQTGAGFPILTDTDNGYALSLNLAIWVGAEMQRLMTDAGWDIAPYQGNDTWMLPIPATFVVGADGRIVERFIDPDYRKRMEIDDMLNALRAACSPGDATSPPTAAD